MQLPEQSTLYHKDNKVGIAVICHLLGIYENIQNLFFVCRYLQTVGNIFCLSAFANAGPSQGFILVLAISRASAGEDPPQIVCWKKHSF